MRDEAPLPLWSVTDNSVTIEYGRFNLVDDEAEPEDAIEFELAEPDWAVAGDGWVALASDGSGHQPQVTIEAWAVEPAADNQVWDRELVLEATFDSVLVRLWGTPAAAAKGHRWCCLEATTPPTGCGHSGGADAMGAASTTWSSKRSTTGGTGSPRYG